MKALACLFALGLLTNHAHALFFPIPIPIPIPIPDPNFDSITETLFEPGIKLFDVTVDDPLLTATVSSAAISFIAATTGLQLPQPKVTSVKAEVRIALSRQISVQVGLLYEKVRKPDGTTEDDQCYVRITHGYYSPIACYIEKFVCNGIIGSFPPVKK